MPTLPTTCERATCPSLTPIVRLAVRRDYSRDHGEDLRLEPIEDRKFALKKLLAKSHPGISYNRHFDVEGAIVFKNACRLGCEGIASKRLGSPCRSGRSADWIKVKNSAAPAVKREAEEDWGGKWNGR